MRLIVRLFALGLAVVVLALWFFGGPNLGWTKNKVGRPLKDEVTGIETVVYEDRWVPGVDFLAGGLLAAGMVAGGSYFFRPAKRLTTGKATKNI